MNAQPLARRIFLLFGAAFFLLLGLTSLVIYAFFSNLLVSQTEDYLHLVMQQNQSILNSYIKRVDEVAVDTANDRFLYQTLSQPLSDSFVDQTITRQTLNNYLITAVYVPLRKYFKTVNYWFFIDESLPASAMYSEYSFPNNKVVTLAQATQLGFFDQTLEAGGKVYWFFDPAKPSKISAACLIRGSFSKVNLNNIGILLLEFDLADLFGNVQRANLTDNSAYFFIDAAGSPHTAQADERAISAETLLTALRSAGYAVPSGSGQAASFRAENHFISILPLDSNWLLVGVTPFSDILSQTRRISEFLLPVTVVSLLAVLLLSFLIARSVSKPIASLSRVMQKSASEADLDVVLPPHPQTIEIAALFHSYTQLIERIKVLLKEVYDRGVSEKQAEIRMLQAQINPHFLYNTLDSISWAAMDLGDQEIPAVVSSLSNILRYSIKEPDKLARLDEELEIVRNYLAIQRFCYSLDIQIRVQGEAQDAADILLPKLTLQPIVENAILHGYVEQGRKNGEIVFRFFSTGDDLVCEIENEGSADIALMEEILVSPNPSPKHGIRNVHQRLRMLFGGDSGLRFYQTETGLFVVVLTVREWKKIKQTSD